MKLPLGIIFHFFVIIFFILAIILTILAGKKYQPPQPAKVNTPISPHVLVSQAATISGTVKILLIPTATVLPSITTKISITPIPINNTLHTNLSLSLCLTGISSCNGTIQTSVTNTKPQHPERTVAVRMFDASRHLTAGKIANLHYNISSQNFEGSIDMGQIAAGIYTISIKITSYLEQQLPTPLNITPQQRNGSLSATLTPGDFNNDGVVDLKDYAILLSCYGPKENMKECLDKIGPDIDDDGIINTNDYTLFLRSLTQGQ